MTNHTPPIFGEKEATALLDAGWSQAQVLRPTENLPSIAADSFFIVCTQSCSVVSQDLTRDPFVELAEARPVRRYNPRCEEARGRNVRKFHVAVGNADFGALEVNINARHFVKRELLLGIQLAGFSVSEQARREFAGWIARYYSRIALPNELVLRFRKTVLSFLKGFVEAKAGEPPIPRHEHISSMWIRFDPDAEVGAADSYSVDILMLCDRPEISDEFDGQLVAIFGGRSFSMDGVNFTIEVNTPDETRLSDLRGWNRFPEWDHLSGMWETATTPVEH
jgi:hypothetical protein